MPLAVYDRTIGVMKDAVRKAKLGAPDRLAAVRKLDLEARRVERWTAGPSFEAFLAEERRCSPDYDGRTVAGPARHDPARVDSRRGW